MNSFDLAAWLDDCQQVEPVIFKVCAQKLRQQADKIADQQTTIKFLEEECKALREQLK